MSSAHNKFKSPLCKKCKESLIFKEGIREEGIYFSIGECIKCNKTYKIGRNEKMIIFK